MGNVKIILSKRSVHRALAAGKEVGDPIPQGFGFRGIVATMGIDPVRGGALGLLQGLQVAAEACYPEGGQAGLPGAKEIARAPEGQIFLRDLKTVGGFAQSL